MAFVASDLPLVTGMQTGLNWKRLRAISPGLEYYRPNVAAELGITTRTVETRRAKIMLKLGLHSLTELIHYAIRHEIFSPPGASD